jgi:uncharacterized tellurite resistance protein B-like protein
MLSDLRNYFHGIDSVSVDKDGKPTSDDLKLAAAMLLLECARVDGSYQQVEAQTIAELIENNFGLDQKKTLALIEKADTTRPDHEKFVQYIRDGFDESQKQLLLSLLWRAIAADGVADKLETAFATTLRTQLGLTMEQSIRARRLAESGTDLTIEEIKREVPERS